MTVDFTLNELKERKREEEREIEIEREAKNHIYNRIHDYEKNIIKTKQKPFLSKLSLLQEAHEVCGVLSQSYSSLGSI